MILRLSQKLNIKLKGGALAEMPLDVNPCADWSSNLFTADRTQYIILTNTASFYSCVMPGRGIADESTFIARALETIREFTADDGQQFLYRKFIAPSAAIVRFAKALNRSVTGSMNDHIHAAKVMLEDGMAQDDILGRTSGRIQHCQRWTDASGLADSAVQPDDCLEVA
ncbi:MAG TPA: hypothetical protein DDZ51_05485 [Planctomycetaceae bacterium]|nr:hypothetical protein [Planctomycetaceae bacterium]